MNPSGRPVLLELFTLLKTLGLNPVVVSDRRDKYADLGISCLVDVFPGMGPLCGIYTALRLVRTEKILVLTCDMPLVGLDTLRKILQIGRTVPDAVVYAVESDLQPFPGIYSKKLLIKIKNYLSGGCLAVKDVLWSLSGLTVIPVYHENGDFFDMNTQEDYQRLKKLFHKKGGMDTYAGTL